MPYLGGDGFYMAKTRKVKKTVKHSWFRSLMRGAIRIIFPVALAGAIIALLCVGVVNYFLRSEQFKIMSVVFEGSETDPGFSADEILERFKSKNIFQIDLEEAENYLRTRYIDIKNVTVRKVLPDRLSVTVQLRKPAALIKDERYIPVDNDGVLLSGTDKTRYAGLPVIEGVRLRRSELASRRCGSRNMRAALALLRAMEASGILQEYEIGIINVSDYRNPLFFIDDGMEIRVGQNSLEGQLKRLKAILKDPAVNSEKVRYIDLRFKDNVIGPK